MSYLEALTEQKPKSSKRQDLLRLAMELLSLSMDGELNDAGFAVKDGTGPEIYVAPRVTPVP